MMKELLGRRVAIGALVHALVLAACSSSTSPPTTSEITANVEARRLELTNLRREIHRHPELSGQEVQTAARVEERLRALGLEIRTGVGGHGIVAVLRGAYPGPTVAYRADMDAMPDQEPPGREYGSTVPGVFHVCGHDLHTTIGVGIASVLTSYRSEMHGTVVFLFQPAEETVEGAAAMLRDGALDGFTPDVVYALHSGPIPVGTITRGSSLAGFDQFRIELDAAHSTPAIVSQLKANLAPIGTAAPPRTAEDVDRFVADLKLSDGPYEHGVFLRTPEMTVDDHVVIRGSVKACADADYPRIRDAVREAVTRELGETGYVLSFREGGPFPSMRSDERVASEAAVPLRKLLGEENVLSWPGTMPFASEDFAYFLARTPGTMFFLGVANRERGMIGFPHFPDFDADEEALVVGTKAMSVVILDRLSRR